MQTYVLFLRAINVSGKNKINMSDLQDVLAGASLRNVSTYLQSGNVVFQSDCKDSLVLQKQIQESIQEQMRLEIEVLVLEKEVYRSRIENFPWKSEESNKVHITFFFEKATVFPAEKVEKAKVFSEQLEWRENCVFLFCPEGYGKTKLSNRFWESQLKFFATTRNWKTCCAVLEMLENTEKSNE